MITILSKINSDEIKATDMKVGETAIIVDSGYKGILCMRTYLGFVGLHAPNTCWNNSVSGFTVRLVDIEITIKEKV